MCIRDRLNAFTGQQLILNADPSDHVGLVLYGLLCGTVMCISSIMIIHHYGIATFYTRNAFHIEHLNESCWQQICHFCRSVKERCLQSRLRGGCDVETVNPVSYTHLDVYKRQTQGYAKNKQ